MMTRILVALVVLVMSAASAAAQPKIETGPIKRTPAYDAKTMFDSYCAVCHGRDGKGNGSAAPALAKVPADLTHISTRAGGVFPAARVKRYIEGLDSAREWARQRPPPCR